MCDLSIRDYVLPFFSIFSFIFFLFLFLFLRNVSYFCFFLLFLLLKTKHFEEMGEWEELCGLEARLQAEEWEELDDVSFIVQEICRMVLPTPPRTPCATTTLLRLTLLHRCCAEAEPVPLFPPT